MSETSTDSQRTLSDHGKQDKSFSLAKSMEFWVSYKDCCYWKADVKTMDFFYSKFLPRRKLFPTQPDFFPLYKIDPKTARVPCLLLAEGEGEAIKTTVSSYGIRFSQGSGTSLNLPKGTQVQKRL